jgi:IgA Peptidase M64/Peptidase M64 N-terminus
LLFVGVLVRAGLLDVGALVAPTRTPLENANGALAMAALFAAAAQVFNCLTPEAGLLNVAFNVFFLALLWNTLAADPDARRLLRSLFVVFGSAFVLKYVLLASMYDPDGGLARRVFRTLLEGVTLGSLGYEPHRPATGYVAFFVVVLFLFGLFLLPRRGRRPRVDALVSTRVLAMALAVGAVATSQADAAPRTMRVDYFHAGTSKEEHFSLDRVVVEPLEWPGHPGRPIDDTNLGKYLFEVVDRATNRVLYSRGFASIFGEWETTPEADTTTRTFHESVRFAAPERPVRLVLKERDARNDFRELWSLVVDPHDMFVDSSKPPSPGPLVTLERNGDPADKVDLLILGDGYTAQERGKCEADARRLVGILFDTSPFKERRREFNTWALCPASAESGISRPSTGLHRRTAVAATYDAFRSERYVLTFDNRAFREVASFAPYEFVEILTNTRTYGGGGIFGLYATVAADSAWASYVFIHEFGHHFAALADEYYTSDVAYKPATITVEPWEPNVTALLDPPQLKWKDLVAAETPLPTPWQKEAFEKQSRAIQDRRRAIRAANRLEEEMDALFREQRGAEEKLLAAERHAGEVGAFEGANYEARGYYRPQTDCIMFTRNRVPFCRVCRRAIARVIDLYSRGGAETQRH